MSMLQDFEGGMGLNTGSGARVGADEIGRGDPWAHPAPVIVVSAELASV